MKEFFNNLATAINNWSPLLKTLVMGLLLIMDILCIIQIVKTHVNPKKMVFKIGQFLLLALFLTITVYISANL